MSKHFCCCIPVRAAVFFFSLLSLLASGAVAGFLWFILNEITTGKTVGNVDFAEIKQSGKIAVIVAASLFTLIFLISLFGFVGSVLRKRRFVKSYSYLIWVVFIIAMAAAGVFFYVIFSGKNLFNGCQINVNGTTQECKLDFPLWQKVVSVTAVIVLLFILLYIAVVIRRYVDQLEDEHDYQHEYKLAKHNNASTYTPTYYPPTAQESGQGLLNHPTSQYPYSDAAHSFGHTKV